MNKIKELDPVVVSQSSIKDELINILREQNESYYNALDVIAASHERPDSVSAEAQLLAITSIARHALRGE